SKVVDVGVTEREHRRRAGEIGAKRLYSPGPAKERSAQEDERMLPHVLALLLEVGLYDRAPAGGAALAKPFLEGRIYLLKGHGAPDRSRRFMERSVLPSYAQKDSRARVRWLTPLPAFRVVAARALVAAFKTDQRRLAAFGALRHATGCGSLIGNQAAARRGKLLVAH